VDENDSVCPRRTVRPVDVHGWFACTVTAPGTDGVAAAPVVPVAVVTLFGRAMTIRATSLDDRSRSPLPVLIDRRSGLAPPMSISWPSIV
jgi:hypothetical protein